MMAKEDKIRKFLEYVRSPLSNTKIEKLYKDNNISYDKCMLFNDYIQSLFTLIFDTYMGDDFTDDNDKCDHFLWCWNQNIKNFEKEEIYFKTTQETFDFFFGFIIDVFYYGDKSDSLNSSILDMWESVFSYKTVKSHSDVDGLIEVYKDLEKSLKSKKKNF